MIRRKKSWRREWGNKRNLISTHVPHVGKFFFFCFFVTQLVFLVCRFTSLLAVRFWVCRYRHTIPFVLSRSVFILITIQCERVTSIKSKSPSFVALISFRFFFTRYKCVFALHPDFALNDTLKSSTYVDSMKFAVFLNISFFFSCYCFRHNILTAIPQLALVRVDNLKTNLRQWLQVRVGSAHFRIPFACADYACRKWSCRSLWAWLQTLSDRIGAARQVVGTRRVSSIRAEVWTQIHRACQKLARSAGAVCRQVQECRLLEALYCDANIDKIRQKSETSKMFEALYKYSKENVKMIF